jgi:hypothetical protein
VRPSGRAVAALLSGLATALTGCATPPDSVRPKATPTFAPAGKVTCDETAFEPRTPGAWTHPQQNFYAPGEPAPTESDLNHLMRMDNAAVVRYRPDASSDAREELRAWAPTQTALVVVPSRRRGAPQVEAFSSNRHLICDGVDADQLTVFASRRGNTQIVPHDDSGTG